MEGGSGEGREFQVFNSRLTDSCVCSALSGDVCVETSYFLFTSIHKVGGGGKNRVHNEQNSSGTEPHVQELPRSHASCTLWLAFLRQASLFKPMAC